MSTAGRRSSGRTRRVGIVVPSFLMVPSLLESSNLICMLPSRCAPPNTGQRFAVFDPPIAIEGFPLHLAWHAPRDQDEGVQHVAGSCDRCCKLLLSQAGTAASVWRTRRRSSAERARCKLAGEPESTGATGSTRRPSGSGRSGPRWPMCGHRAGRFLSAEPALN